MVANNGGKKKGEKKKEKNKDANPPAPVHRPTVVV
jgi:hypothetical protein